MLWNRVDTAIAGCIIFLVLSGVSFMVDSVMYWTMPPTDYVLFTTAAFALCYVLVVSLIIYWNILRQNPDDTSNFFGMHGSIFGFDNDDDDEEEENGTQNSPQGVSQLKKLN
ncbi:hypothetical protein CDAR_393121 [Caerostris darwini]|uniref:Uncharacterized protein n=1 Tax=Caerostris darwini TaxID=1538125 RepID=A0AAV4RXC7_9ARAC|nr:hypothetical protein CDAR_393121 [Caerostris darwini]